jgi:hypothetical protein
MTMHQPMLRIVIGFFVVVCCSLAEAKKTIYLHVESEQPVLTAELVILNPSGKGSKRFQATFKKKADYYGTAISIDFNKLAIAKKPWLLKGTLTIETKKGTQEQLFVYFRADEFDQQEVYNLYLYEFDDPDADTVKTYENIRLMATEKDLLKAYFAFRRLYFALRPNDDPGKESELVVRTAKNWFDAAYDLAILPNRPYRMDELLIAKVIGKYVDYATNKPAFQKNSIMKFETLQGYLNSAKFVIFGQNSLFDDLVATDQFDHARRLNNELFARYCRLGNDRVYVDQEYAGLLNILQKNAKDLLKNEKFQPPEVQTVCNP